MADNALNIKIAAVNETRGGIASALQSFRAMNRSVLAEVKATQKAQADSGLTAAMGMIRGGGAIMGVTAVAGQLKAMAEALSEVNRQIAEGEMDARDRGLEMAKAVGRDLPFGIGQALQAGEAFGKWLWGISAAEAEASQRAKEHAKAVAEQRLQHEAYVKSLAAGKATLAKADEKLNPTDQLTKDLAGNQAAYDAAMKAARAKEEQAKGFSPNDRRRTELWDQAQLEKAAAAEVKAKADAEAKAARARVLGEDSATRFAGSVASQVREAQLRAAGKEYEAEVERINREASARLEEIQRQAEEAIRKAEGDGALQDKLRADAKTRSGAVNQAAEAERVAALEREQKATREAMATEQKTAAEELRRLRLAGLEAEAAAGNKAAEVEAKRVRLEQERAERRQALEAVVNAAATTEEQKAEAKSALARLDGEERIRQATVLMELRLAGLDAEAAAGNKAAEVEAARLRLAQELRAQREELAALARDEAASEEQRTAARVALLALEKREREGASGAGLRTVKSFGNGLDVEAMARAAPGFAPAPGRAPGPGFATGSRAGGGGGGGLSGVDALIAQANAPGSEGGYGWRDNKTSIFGDDRSGRWSAAGPAGGSGGVTAAMSPRTEREMGEATKATRELAKAVGLLVGKLSGPDGGGRVLNV